MAETEEEPFTWPGLRQALVARRKALGYGQRQVADSMGCTQSAVSDLESGKTINPGLTTVVRWAAAVRVGISLQMEFEEVLIQARKETRRLDPNHSVD
jgi:transcriptional regulator with XRE-family HTH domain